jgi:hypothetical protein
MAHSRRHYIIIEAVEICQLFHCPTTSTCFCEPILWLLQDLLGWPTVGTESMIDLSLSCIDDPYGPEGPISRLGHVAS